MDKKIEKNEDSESQKNEESKEQKANKNIKENKELIRRILECLQKPDDASFSQEELSIIENIVFTQVLENGKKTGIGVEDIFLFENLKSITLKNYDFNSEDLKLLCEHPKLQEVSFLQCSFENASFDEKLKYPERLKFICCSRLPKKFPKVDKVLVAFSKLDFDSIDFSRATTLKIKGSEIYNVRNLNEFSNLIEVNLDGSTLLQSNGETLEDIEVGNDCKYSHKIEDRDYVDDVTVDPQKKYEEEIEK